MECLEAETAKLIDKKDRDLYFLRGDLENCEIRLREATMLAGSQQEEIEQLRGQLQQVRGELQQLSLHSSQQTHANKCLED